MPEPLASEGLEVSTAETARALAEDVAQVIDVREDYEREAGRVDGTRHIELNALAAEAATIAPDRPVIFVCRSGARSLIAAQALSQAGFDAYSMAGGLLRWDGEGRPLTPEGGRVADH
jgi:rhodanese-related sulfurtransferase